MKTRRAVSIAGAILVPTLLFILLLGLAGSVVANQPAAQPGAPPFPVPLLVNYQGRLLDDGGTPINDSVDMVFWIYDAPGGGNLMWGPETHSAVPVKDGYFDVLLGSTEPLIQQELLKGTTDRYLEVEVNGEILSPRQRIASVAYAIVANTLVPGAEISGSASGQNYGEALLNIDNTAPSGLNRPALYVRTASGSAVRGESGGVGISGLSGVNYGVYGSSTDSYGGYFYSSEAVGLRAESTGSEDWRDWGIHGVSATAAAVYGQTIGGIGLRGWSENNYGVLGVTTSSYGGYLYSSEGVGLYAQSAGSKIYDYGAEIHSNMGYGLYVTSENNQAIRAVGGSETGFAVPVGTVGVFGGSQDRAGVWGSSRDDSGVYGMSVNDPGVYGMSDNDHGIEGFTEANNVSLAGVYGYSSGSNGVYGRSDGAGDADNGVYGFTNSTTATEAGVKGESTSGASGVYGTNTGTGYGVRAYSAASTAVYADTGRADHQWGVYTPDKMYAGTGYVDIAEHIEAASGVQPGDVVVIDPQGEERVVKSTQPYDTAVAGVISTDPALLIGKADSPTPLSLAGRVPCKVSAENGPILPGDLLTTSSTPGHAMKAEPVVINGVKIYPPGTILGKALEPLEKGTGVIMVLVTLQ